ncbi:D-2-hydroxyacid dehydrogenase [Alkalihalobacterium chitinilyticum]|uniref:D-2-hydroxyacid dehydrogenase n=1 Tax=Alkalihalobacterium chitinilyticum TaxID=2980103 RepID=A0ABT5VGH5_9BACI|nr:D-2-hydroxyacid dehydrogenase [Alkalihalobacterium chitinilyticum]MDE5414558.1 D-2-hydroxyacid dehydrogenase [Alkalihalobacterium chitinilyticum]
MNINNIVVVSPMHNEIKTIINNRNLAYNFRFLPEEKVTTSDLEWADAFVAFNTKKDYDYSQVRWVHSLGAGVDRFLFKKKWPEDVLLTRTVCSFGQRIAEYCLSYILKDVQFHDSFQQLQTNKTWEPITPRLLSEQKVMIFGTGEIGQKTAEVLSTFGIEVYGVSLSGKNKAYFKEVLPVGSHEKRLGEVNYVINTLPLTEKTEKLFDRQIFHSLSNAGFINVGRGASVDEEALLEALDRKHVKFAVLDVFTVEPLPQEHPLWGHPSVTITPHISAVTTPDEGVDCFVDTLRNIEAGNSLRNQVNISKGF